MYEVRSVNVEVEYVYLRFLIEYMQVGIPCVLFKYRNRYFIISLLDYLGLKTCNNLKECMFCILLKSIDNFCCIEVHFRGKILKILGTVEAKYDKTTCH